MTWCGEAFDNQLVIQLISGLTFDKRKEDHQIIKHGQLAFTFIHTSLCYSWNVNTIISLSHWFICCVSCVHLEICPKVLLLVLVMEIGDWVFDGWVHYMVLGGF